MIPRICVGIIMLLLCACSSLPVPTVTAPVKYELLLSGTIDGEHYQGIAVGSSDSSHVIVVQSAVAVNYFTEQSCHRSVQAIDIIKSGPFGLWLDNSTYQFNYIESPTIEDTGDCILRLCAFSKTVGSPPSACAVIDFKSSRYTMPAQNICNGENGASTGTMLCHTQVGLIERVQFPEPMIADPAKVDPSVSAGSPNTFLVKNQCAGKFIDANNSLWEYTVPTTECVAIFMQEAKPHQRAKLTVLPYDTALYPGMAK